MSKRRKAMVSASCMLLLAGIVHARADAPAKPPLVTVVHLSLQATGAPPSTALEPPPANEGIAGARLAIADNATTGRFLNQAFALQEVRATDAAALVQAVTDELAEGRRLFVADLPAPLLTRVADLPRARDAVILDATSPDDALRGADCRANMLHMLPSRAMLADALMQYLVTKGWTRIMLLAGRAPADARYADAIRHSAEKFQVRVRTDATWAFNPAAQQADTGHYQVNDEVVKATQGASYDVLVVADEAGAFGDELAYRTEQPRPIAGTQGLVPAAWSSVMDEYASTQLQLRFHRMSGHWMTSRDYGNWLAVRSIGEAATRSGSTDEAKIVSYLHDPAFSVSGYKGASFSFRPWDGQLRQPVLLADSRSLVSVSPQPGFLHERDDLDSLGTDKPESKCRLQ